MRCHENTLRPQGGALLTTLATRNISTHIQRYASDRRITVWRVICSSRERFSWSRTAPGTFPGIAITRYVELQPTIVLQQKLFLPRVKCKMRMFSHMILHFLHRFYTDGKLSLDFNEIIYSLLHDSFSNSFWLCQHSHDSGEQISNWITNMTIKQVLLGMET